VSLEKISVLGTLVISALRRLRQEDPEFKFNLGFIVSSSKAILGYSDSCQKKKKEGRKEGRERGRKGERRERERKEGRKKKKERKKEKKAFSVQQRVGKVAKGFVFIETGL
jgi:predicted transposase YdaD